MRSKKLTLLLMLIGSIAAPVPSMALVTLKKDICSKDIIFKAITSGCLLGMLVPPISLLLRNAHERLKISKTQPLGPIAAAFIRYTLKLHGYTDQECHGIVFRYSDRFECIDRVISVQFNDKDLLSIIVRLSPIDRRLIVTQLVKHGLPPIKISKTDILKAKVPNTPLFMIRYTGLSKEESQHIFFKKIILEWQASILHEMGHARNQDTQLYRTAVIVSYLPLLWSMDYIAPTIKKKLIMLPFAFAAFYKLIPLSLGKYCEWRADQEVIQRAKDPLILQTEAEFYNALEAFSYDSLQFDLYNGSQWERLQAKILLTFPWLQEIVDEHPRHHRRAQYFKKAFEKKVENENSKQCTLNREINYGKQ